MPFCAQWLERANRVTLPWLAQADIFPRRMGLRTDEHLPISAVCNLVLKTRIGEVAAAIPHDEVVGRLGDDLKARNDVRCEMFTRRESTRGGALLALVYGGGNLSKFAAQLLLKNIPHPIASGNPRRKKE